MRPIEALAAELGTVAARVERDLRSQFDVLASDMRAKMAEMELRAVTAERTIAELVANRLNEVKDGQPGTSVTLDDVAPLIRDEVARSVSLIPTPRDGVDGVSVSRDDVLSMVLEAVATIPPAPAGRDADPELVRQMVAAAVAEIPPAQPGKDADPAVIAEMVREAVDAIPRPVDGKDADMGALSGLVRELVAAIPVPKDGQDADPDLIRSMVADAVAAIPPAPAGERGPPGRLPSVKAWTDAVHYDGDVVTMDGSTYQALRDTGRQPPHDDWVCLALAGRDGAQGRSFVVRGTWAEAEEYAELDVVVTNGAAFVATLDKPGACPGDGWQMISAQGKRGKPGEDGRKGDPGPAGPAVIGATVDDMGMLTLRNANGTTVSCDFYPVLSRIDR